MSSSLWNPYWAPVVIPNNRKPSSPANQPESPPNNERGHRDRPTAMQRLVEAKRNEEAAHEYEHRMFII